MHIVTFLTLLPKYFFHFEAMILNKNLIEGLCRARISTLTKTDSGACSNVGKVRMQDGIKFWLKQCRFAALWNLTLAQFISWKN